jgi:hypothetical protein
MLVIVTVLLIVAFGTVVALRYFVIAEQLGINTTGGGTFSQPGSWLIWSRLGPTIAMNLMVWGIGTLVAYALHERVPEFRETYRQLTKSNRKLDQARKPFEQDQRRIVALFEREREKNQVAIKEYRSHLQDVQAMIDRIKG